jgi:DEAD/DEAH box helicase domain-containing protein
MLILSGTGSGKTECVLMPIVDACIRQPDPGVKGVIVYPMTRLPTISSSA